MTELQLRMPVTAVINEYNKKKEALEKEYAAFMSAGTKLRTAATVMGTYGQENIDTGSDYQQHKLERNLLKSAWLTLWENPQFNISKVASANDRKKFDDALGMSTIPEFTLENIKSTFGDYVTNPRQSVLRGLAEVFSRLDPYYKSHEKIKIGVKGMPKRVIISGVSSYTYGYGFDKVKDVLDAIAVYQGIGRVSHEEMKELWEDEYALIEKQTRVVTKYGRNGKSEPQEVTWPSRGIHLRRFKNGNAHLFFTPDTLRDVNLALAEYYGDVLADAYEAKPSKKSESKEVSKDLQYYPTPKNVVDKLIDNVYDVKGKLILEPSCGCGRIMDSLKKKGADVRGVEYDAGRVAECKAKGHDVMQANFLEVTPKPIFDYVIMNPPFAGKHYFKHIQHAMKFLKPDGALYSILPSTARYDHGLIDAEYNTRWTDLPTGSFRESGTNIATSIVTIFNK